MSFRRHFRGVAAATEPSSEAIDRVRRRLAWPRNLARSAAVEPESHSTDRLLARLRTVKPPSRRRRAVATTVALLAALVLLAVAYTHRAVRLSENLSATQATIRDLTADIHLHDSGSGHVDGTSEDAHVRWEIGTLGLEVTPHRGIALTVETDEAMVTVVGTAFSVTRDPLGTAVNVERGVVTVACTGSGLTRVEPGGSALCLPTRAAAMLARAQRLLDDGTSAPPVLEAIARGLALANGDDPTRGELLVLRIQVLMPLHRDAEVAQDARMYLEQGGPRSAEVQAIVEAVRPGIP